LSNKGAEEYLPNGQPQIKLLSEAGLQEMVPKSQTSTAVSRSSRTRLKRFMLRVHFIICTFAVVPGYPTLKKSKTLTWDISIEVHVQTPGAQELRFEILIYRTGW
jgi:hypothetical protein